MVYSSGDRVQPDQEIANGLRLGGIAIVSAVVTAMLVIGAGRVLLPEAQAQAQAQEQPTLIQASLP